MIDSKLVVNIKEPAADLIGSLHVKIVYCFLYTENFMRKCYFSAVIAILLMAVSCMNVGGSSGAEGAVRVAVPGSGSRGAYILSKDNASLYKVTLLLDGEVEGEPQTASPGGADIVFDGLEPAEYTVLVEAFDAGGVMLARKSQSVKVAAGKTADCSIVLALLGSRALDTGYLLWKYESSSGYYIDKLNSVAYFNGNGYVSKRYYGAVEDLESKYYYMIDSFGNGTVTLCIGSNSNKVTISGSNNDFFEDAIYYDDMTDSLWIASSYYDSQNGLFFFKSEQPSDNLSSSTTVELKESSGFDFSDKSGIAFAVQGNDIYIAYQSMKDSCYYLQRGTLSGDGPFTFVPVGSAKSAEDMGLSGAITDVAIFYDGTVYALVSNVGSNAGAFGDMFSYYLEGSTFYSRGALVKIEGTNSGFRVADVLGWTDSARKISPGEGTLSTDNTPLQPINAYIPSLSESNGKFYGPRRFVAIKPKEIAIADCGANFVMPDKNAGKKGKMFEHNRVVTVSLYDFAVSSVKEPDGVKFSNLTLSGLGASSGYIYADGCDDESIEER